MTLDNAQRALRSFSNAYARYGDIAPSLFALVGEANRLKGGTAAEVPPELIHPNAPMTIGQFQLSENARVHIEDFRITLYAVGRGDLRTDEGVYECDFVLRGEHYKSDTAEKAVESFRRVAKESGAALLTDGLAQVDAADSPIILWVCNVLGDLSGTTWVREWPKIGNRRVFSFHPFAASIEAWKRLLSDGQSGAIASKKPPGGGKRKADYDTVQKESKLADEWNRARESRVAKADFSKSKGLKLKELDKLLDRVQKRKRRSGK
ncbi:MAG: hypothetical protein J5I93_14415 [Pirellulaceae bacterium]|nr:hypothetical protein [Pirellulaceae bacterium]